MFPSMADDDKPIEMSAAFTAESKRRADKREESRLLIESSDLIQSFGAYNEAIS